MLASLPVDAVGNVYTVAAIGGAHNNGLVLELSPSGDTWTSKDIYDFDGTHGSGGNGAYLLGGLVADAAGNVYGTMPQGGTSTACSGGCGVAFRLRPDGDTWVQSVMVNFNGTNGSYPGGNLSIDASSNLYGTTQLGGAKGFGTVFELTPTSSNTWRQHLLHAFTDANGDGAQPSQPLTVSNGKLKNTFEPAQADVKIQRDSC